jgi:hypothetical protein
MATRVAASTSGARGGAPKGKANGAYRHGLFTTEAMKERRLLAALLLASQRTVQDCRHELASLAFLGRVFPAGAGMFRR